jgi:hypothetical protein
MNTILSFGSIVYVFDENHRVYPEDKSVSSNPIYREYFRPMKIVGETTRSWLLSNGMKVSKKTLVGIYPNEAAVNQACWVHEHKWKIIRKTENIRDYETLRKLADLVGYDESSA